MKRKWPLIITGWILLLGSLMHVETSPHEASGVVGAVILFAIAASIKTERGVVDVKKGI
jgi:hypothetical protein